MIRFRRWYFLLAAIPAVANAQTVCRSADKLSANLIQQISAMLTTNDSLRIYLTVPVVPDLKPKVGSGIISVLLA